jgi:polyhydroxyalkanoate synthesis regulator phasin
MGVTERLKAQAMGLSQKAMERLFADEKRAAKVAEVIGAAQRGKAAFDKGQRELMHQLNFASRTDFKEIGKQLSAMKRRVRDLEAKLDGELRS